MTGGDLTNSQIQKIENSRVVHISLDSTVDIGSPPEGDENAEEGGDPDRVITKARRCTSDDGLLSPTELADAFKQLGALRSAYHEGNQRLGAEESKVFGSRGDLVPGDVGCCEPAWTAYAHYWKATLGELDTLMTSARQLVTQIARLHIFLGSETATRSSRDC